MDQVMLETLQRKKSSFTNIQSLGKDVIYQWVKTSMECPQCGKKGSHFQSSRYYCSHCESPIVIAVSYDSSEEFHGHDYYTLMEQVYRNSSPDLLLIKYNLFCQEILSTRFIKSNKLLNHNITPKKLSGQFLPDFILTL